MSRKVIDWEAVETHYRAGIRSLKDIGGEFGVSDAAIIKRAKRDSWARDLKAKIRAKAAQKVSDALVSEKVSAESKATERDRIEIESEIQARIELAHRTDVPRTRRLVMGLIEELEHQTDNRALYAELAEIMHAPDKNGVDRLNDLYRKVISHGNRTDSAKKLAEALKTLVSMEREIFGIEARRGVGEGLEELLGKLDG